MFVINFSWDFLSSHLYVEFFSVITCKLTACPQATFTEQMQFSLKLAHSSHVYPRQKRLFKAFSMFLSRIHKLCQLNGFLNLYFRVSIIRVEVICIPQYQLRTVHGHIADGHFANRQFDDRQFDDRTFRQENSSPTGLFAVRIVH